MNDNNLLLSFHLSVCLLCLCPPVSLVEITIRVDESECLSMASSHDQETERFLSTGTTGRRVSFNEAALFDHGKKAQEKGRRLESQHTQKHTFANAFYSAFSSH